MDKIAEFIHALADSDMECDIAIYTKPIKAIDLTFHRGDHRYPYRITTGVLTKTMPNLYVEALKSAEGMYDSDTSE